SSRLQRRNGLEHDLARLAFAALRAAELDLAPTDDLRFLRLDRARQAGEAGSHAAIGAARRPAEGGDGEKHRRGDRGVDVVRTAYVGQRGTGVARAKAGDNDDTGAA